MKARSYRLVLAGLPMLEDRRELLELVLAAVSLDLDVQLLLQGEALGLLWPKIDAGWQQLLDEQFAEILVCPPAGWAGNAPTGVRVLDADAVPELPLGAIELNL